MSIESEKTLFFDMESDDNHQSESDDEDGTNSGLNYHKCLDFSTKTGLSVWYFRPNRSHPTKDYCNIYLRRRDSTGIHTLFFSIEDLVEVVRELIPYTDTSVWGGMQYLLPATNSPTCPIVKFNMSKMYVTMSSAHCKEFNFGLGAVNSLVKKLILFYSMNSSVIVTKKQEAEKSQVIQHLADLELIKSLTSKVARYEQKEKK